MKPRMALSSAFLATTILCGAVAAWLWLSALTVVVRNTGDSALKDVVVHVTGNSYALGDLGAGTEKRVLVQPTGESHIELSLRSNEGRTERKTADCYFEPGYRGTIGIDVCDGHITQVRQRGTVSSLLY